jgi:hypothetical protein
LGILGCSGFGLKFLGVLMLLVQIMERVSWLLQLLVEEKELEHPR